jgi:hypothetical protein
MRILINKQINKMTVFNNLINYHLNEKTVFYSVNVFTVQFFTD